jgi:carbonic anhydrase
MCQQEEKKSCWGDSCFRDNSEMILKRLKDGNKRFIKGNLERPNQSKQRRQCTASHGQRPYAVVLSCADSRVPPELIFDTGIADLFVVRVAGNIANSSSIASIEFATAVLGCEFILVLGHEGCGAVQTAIDGGEAPSKDLKRLLAHIKPAVNDCKCESHDKKTATWETIKEEYKCGEVSTSKRLRKVTIQNTLLVKELLEKNEIIKSHKVKIHTGYYKLASGKVKFDLPSEC